MDNFPETSEKLKLVEILETIRLITMQTHNPDEIRHELQLIPDFDIGDLSLDAEIYFALATRFISYPRPINEANYSLDEEEIEALLVSISTLRKTIKTLGKSIDSTYFEIQPKGDEFQELRESRILLLNSTLSDFEV